MSDDKLKNVISIFEFIKNNINQDPASAQIKNDYETFKSFVSQYPAWFDLATKYKKNPGELLKLFSLIGQEVVNRSNDILVTELSNQLTNFVSAKNIKLSDSAIGALDNLIVFIKQQNEVKNVS